MRNKDLVKITVSRIIPVDIRKAIRFITKVEDFPKYIGMPRGSLQEIKDLFESLQIKLDLPVNEKNVKRKT